MCRRFRRSSPASERIPRHPARATPGSTSPRDRRSLRKARRTSSGETPGTSHWDAPAAGMGLLSGEVAGDAGAIGDVAVSRGGDPRLVKCLRKRYEVTIRGYRRQHSFERIYGDDVLVTQRRERGRRAGAVVARVSEVVGALRGVSATGNTRILP